MLEKGGKRDKRSEEPKNAFGRNRATALWHFLLFHAIPLTGALSLIVLNLQTRFWGAGGTWISLLQFVAKGHEMLMQASIGVVILSYLQHLLIHKRNIPFGAVFSYYQISQLNYLWSSEFYATLTTPSFQGFLRAGFILFIPFSILLATGVGPSSAIALQPRLVNFTVPDQQVYFNLTLDDLYPTSFSDAGPPLNFSNATNGFRYSYLSPAASWKSLQRLPTVDGDQSLEIGWQIEQRTIEHKYSMPKLYNIDVEQPKNNTINVASFGTRQLFLQFAPNSTFATTHYVFISTLYGIGEFSTRGLRKVIGNRPTTMINENDTRPIEFPDTYVAGCGNDSQCYGSSPTPLNEDWGTTNFSAITRRQIWEHAKDNPEGRILWIDDIKVRGPVPGSALGAIVVQPDFCKTKTNFTFLTTTACVIGGVWANATSSIQTIAEGVTQLHSSITEDTFNTLAQWSKPPVRLSKTWAESLNSVTDIQNRTVVDNLLRWMPQTRNICPTNGSFNTPTQDGSYPENTDQMGFEENRPFMHEALLASLVANGMAHAGGFPDDDYWWYGERNFGEIGVYRYVDGVVKYLRSKRATRRLEDIPGVILRFEIRLHGYAYNLQGVSIKIALPILMLYCTYIIAYALFAFITGQSSRTWGTMAGFTALSINSTPMEALKHTSAGINQTETFRQMVSVREVEDHDRQLELVFDRGENKGRIYRRVAFDRKY